jgi:hypothetical protein
MAKSFVNVLITGDVKGLSNAVSEANGLFSKFGSAAKVAVAGIATAFAGAAVAAKPLIDAASNLAETQSKVGVIFGDAAKDVESFAKDAASMYGQSQQQALDAAATFAIFGKSAGLAGDDLVGFSTDFVGLASDLASFNNTSPEDAIMAIGAALRGESEPIRRYGVLLNDAALKQRALEMGIYDGKGALTAQQKVLAASGEIFAQTSLAQGDFERTSDGLANQQRILKAQLSNVGAEIGTVLLPIVLQLANFIGDKVIPVINKLSETFSKDGLAGVVGLAADFIKQEGPKALSALGDFLRELATFVVETGLPWLLEKLEKLAAALVEWIEPRIKPMLEKLGEFLGKAANWLINDGLPMLVDKLVQLGNALVEWIGPNIEPMLKELGKFLAKLLEWILTEAVPKITAEALKLAGALLAWLAELLPQALKGLGSFILEIVKAIPGLFLDLVNAMFNAGKDLGSKLIDGMIAGLGAVVEFAGTIGQEIADAVWGAIKWSWNNVVADPVNAAVRTAVDLLDKLLGPTINFPEPGNIIPRLAKGGIVTGPTLALIGEAGPEAVIPLSSPNAPDMGGTTIVVNIAGSVTSERDLVESIRKGLLKSQQSGRSILLT